MVSHMFTAWHFCSFLTTKIASVVPLSGANLNCHTTCLMRPTTIHSNFHGLSSFHCLLGQLQALSVASVKSITLANVLLLKHRNIEYSMTVMLLTEQHLEFLSLRGGYLGSSVSILVKITHCWKTHVMAQLYLL